MIGAAKKITPTTTERFKGNLEDDAQNTKLVHKTSYSTLDLCYIFLAYSTPKRHSSVNFEHFLFAFCFHNYKNT